ncbi:MAG: hypothetical protein VR65_06235 [Desulfobulbaceae bacterium BRH_c16a]|nr:MAG: hypothetical protein VR65_06235 [Desulfobulbaceae bacterium BRH_c16a]
MRKQKVIKIGDQEITVNELTSAQIDELLSTFNGDRAVHPTELLLDSVIPVEAVTLSTGIAGAKLGGKECENTPTELDEIWKAVAEVNDFLSRLLERLAKQGHALLTAASSAEPAAD